MRVSASLHASHVCATHLLLHDRELLQVALEEGHLLLLGLAVGVADDIVVLLLDLVQLNLKFDNL